MRLSAYIYVIGAIDYNVAGRIAVRCNDLSKNHEKVFLMMCVPGGFLDGCLALNQYLQANRCIHTHNIASVQSGGVVAYAGANTRTAAAGTYFMIHAGRLIDAEYVGITANRAEALIERLRADDNAYIAEIQRVAPGIGDARISDFWADRDVLITADQAVEIGLAQSIEEISPVKGDFIEVIN